MPFNIYKYGFVSLNGFDEKLRENKDLILINVLIICPDKLIYKKGTSDYH